MNGVIKGLFWLAISILGAAAYAVLAFHRGESLSSIYILIAAFCTFAIGYRFYSHWIAAKVLMMDARRATPCEVHDDGKDFVKTNKWIVFGHHFAAISGPGPLVGPVLAAQFGYLPGILWILIGVVLGGAVQDFVILFCSLRRDGKSLGEMVKEEINTAAGTVAIVAILAILTILLAVLALVVARALAESPWGVFTVGATIPIAMLMGGYLRYMRVGKVLEATVLGVVLLLGAVYGGKLIYADPVWSARFMIDAKTLAWWIIFYGLAASMLPVWLLLAPRDYLSTFMKLGTIFALAFGILVTLPHLKMPALSRFVDGSGLVFSGKVFPFCFITIACGAISGFHALIASGTTPKLVTREHYARPIGYGAMCFESLVAVMALIAACTLDPGVYLSVNVKGDPAKVVEQVSALGFPVTLDQMQNLAQTVGEKTLFGRTGGAATLAVGMAQIFARFVKGHGLDLWYHFAIMFEALFILTTLDAGTRVGRYLLQDALGHIWKPLGDTRRVSANVAASVLMVCAWGYFLIQGINDPLGGINSLWPLFGIANQLLSVIALCLAATIILKMHLVSPTGSKAGRPRPLYMGIVLAPLLWLLIVTTTAGRDKILSEDPKIGFLAQARLLESKLPALRDAMESAKISGEYAMMAATNKAVLDNRKLQFNNRLDALVTAIFMALVFLIVVLSVREWILLLAGKKKAMLRETDPVWLPASALSDEKPVRWFGLFAIFAATARELSGETEMQRLQLAHEAAILKETPNSMVSCSLCATIPDDRLTQKQRIYIHVAEKRFKGINRCC